MRVDARSLAAQGIDREPLPRLPRAAISAERRGERSEVAEQIRERYRARVAARAERAAGAEPARDAGTSALAPLEGAQARQRQAVRDWLEYRAAQGSGAPGAVSPAERMRREALVAWRERREKGSESSAVSRSPAHDSGAQPQEAPGPDRDLSW